MVYGMDIGFLIVIPFIIIGVFVLLAVIGLIKNNNSPRLTVDATVVSKRMKISHHDDHSSTKYYVTFQVASGDRMEFRVRGREQGMLAEGDHGKLTFQGTRYLGFQRVYNSPQRGNAQVQFPK